MNRTILHNDIVRAGLIKQINNLPADGTMVVEIKKNKMNRSLAQNALSWLWYGEIGSELGYTVEEVHDVMCDMVLGKRAIENKITGEITEVSRGTSDLNVEEFTGYLQQVERIAAEQGLILSHPEDRYYKAMGYV